MRLGPGYCSVSGIENIRRPWSPIEPFRGGSSPANSHFVISLTTELLDTSTVVLTQLVGHRFVNPSSS